VTAERRGTLYLVGAALLFSTGGVGIKAVDAPALTVAGCRSAVAALALVVLLRPRGWRWTVPLVVTIATYALLLTTFVVATKWTTAANAVFLQFSGVVWVLLLAPRLLGEPRGPRDTIAIGVALAGLSLLLFSKLEPPGAGDAVAVLSGMFYAALMLLLRRERGVSAEAAVTLGNAAGAAVLLPVVLVTTGLHLSLRSVAILGWLGVFQIAAAVSLMTRGLRHVGAAPAALIGMLEPVANPVWVLLALGEVPTLPSMIGGLMVIAAVAWRTSATPVTTQMLPPE
jgi:drug/metabolite transporter (DMT)-like permease